MYCVLSRKCIITNYRLADAQNTFFSETHQGLFSHVLRKTVVVQVRVFGNLNLKLKCIWQANCTVKLYGYI